MGELRNGECSVSVAGVRRVEPKAPPAYAIDDTQRLVAAVNLLRLKPAIIVGPKGSGRTSMLSYLANGVPSRCVFRIGPDLVGRDGAEKLVELFQHRGHEKPIYCVDDVDDLAGFESSEVNEDFIRELDNARHLVGFDLVLTIAEHHLSTLRLHVSGLVDDAVIVNVPRISEEELDAKLNQELERQKQRRRIEVSPALMQHVKDPPATWPSHVHPGLGLNRLDAACSLAEARGDELVELRHLDDSRAATPRLAGAADLVKRLESRVVGQREAIERVARRLALTMAQLDLRPQRPDGVFLFAGPSGVGKTALAFAIAEEVFGSGENLIRLDMSEFADQQSAARITGPAPGLVGANVPQGWVISRIAQRPTSVILLDEFDKAHADVQSLFLQAFDAGILTSSAGVQVDLRRNVFILTTNQGAQEAISGKAGFGSDSDEDYAGKMRAHVEKHFGSPLVNRIDEIAVFYALTESRVLEIAKRGIKDLQERLSHRGINFEVDEEVVKHLARFNYEETKGARHLLGNIESILVAELMEVGTRRMRVSMHSGGLVVEDCSD